MLKKITGAIEKSAQAIVNEYGFYADLIATLEDNVESISRYVDSEECIRGAQAILACAKVYAKTKTEQIRER